MKYLLSIVASFCCITCFSQEQNDIQKLLRPYKKSVPHKTLPSDSIRLSIPANTIPNAIKTPLPSPIFISNNGNGHDIYILPIDNMPVIMPDTTYNSKMSTGGRWKRTNRK